VQKLSGGTYIPFIGAKAPFLLRFTLEESVSLASNRLLSKWAAARNLLSIIVAFIPKNTITHFAASL